MNCNREESQMLFFCTEDQLLIPYKIKLVPASLMNFFALRSKAISSILSRNKVSKTGQVVCCHPLAAPIGIKTSQKVRNIVSSANEADIVWPGATLVAPSAAGVLQMYADKYHTKMKS